MSNRLASRLRDDIRFEIPPDVTDWLEANIVIPAQMSPRTPGPFRTASRPFMRSVFDCFHPFSGVRACTFAGAAQDAGKTTVMTLGEVYLEYFSRMPSMLMGPSEHWAVEKLVKERLHPLINANPILAKLKPENPDHFTNLWMAMKRGAVNVVGANSATSLAGGTKGRVLIDEAAKIEHTIREDAPETHPILNAWERTKDYKGSDFHWMSATPNSPHHEFWLDFEVGTQTHFHVPCPHCGEYFPFEFEQDKQIKMAEDCQELAKPDYYRSVIWAEDARGKRGKWDAARIHATVRYICPHNGCEIEERHRRGMIDKYMAVHHNKDAPLSHRSFRVPGFYGPNTRFGDLAVKFTQKGSGKTTGLQAFFNSWLALPWTTLDFNVKDEHIVALCGTYARGTLPFKPAVLLLTADPGEALTHWMVTAVSTEGELFVIDWGTVLSPRELISADFLRARVYAVAGTGEKILPQIAYIDSGFQTEEQYKICKNSGGWMWPMKGTEAKHGGWNKTKVQAFPGMELYTYADVQAKDALYGQRIARAAKPGVVLPEDIDGALLLGLGGQQKDKVKGEWKKLANDHLGDCLKLALVGSWIAEPLLAVLRRPKAASG